MGHLHQPKIKVSLDKFNIDKKFCPGTGVFLSGARRYMTQLRHAAWTI